MDMLSGIRMFIDVARLGSFSATARHLGIAPSSVTRQLDGLERGLGVRLFNRTTRNLALTQAGRVYHDHATRIVAQVDEANRAVGELEAAPRGVLRVTAPLSFGRLHIAPALSEFLDRFPELQVDLSLTDQFADLVANGIDVAIRIANLKDSSLVARKLMPMRRVVCASPRYLDRRGKPEKPQDLAWHNCLLFKFSSLNERWEPSANVWKFDGPDGAEQVQVNGSVLSDDADALVAAAVEGMGLVLMPNWLVTKEIGLETLMPILKDYEPRSSDVDRAIYAVYPHGRYVSPKLRVFIDFISQRFMQESIIARP